MSTDTILDRLLVCNLEIPGINYAWRLPPDNGVQIGSFTPLPVIFVRPLGMTGPIPRTAPGIYRVARRWLMRLLVAPSTTASLENSTEGAKTLAQAAALLDPVIDYYANHPRLHTNAGLGELGTLSDDVSIQDNGVMAGIPAPDGQMYAGVEFTLTIEEQRSTARNFS